MAACGDTGPADAAASLALADEEERRAHADGARGRDEGTECNCRRDEDEQFEHGAGRAGTQVALAPIPEALRASKLATSSLLQRAVRPRARGSAREERARRRADVAAHEAREHKPRMAPKVISPSGQCGNSDRGSRRELAF